MSKKILFLLVIIVFFCHFAVAQFTKEEIAEFKKWEGFLINAEIVSSRPWEETPAVTDPWVLTLEKDGITKQAMWKKDLREIEDRVNSLLMHGWILKQRNRMFAYSERFNYRLAR